MHIIEKYIRKQRILQPGLRRMEDEKLRMETDFHE